MKVLAISTLLWQIDNGVLALPKFQRPFVWKRGDVTELMRSLYKGYPVGNLLVWETKANVTDVKGNQPIAAGVNNLLLDGQQRVTSLYGIIRGRKPDFSDADPKEFLNLHFNVEKEDFAFHSPAMKNDPHWISVTELMQAQKGEWAFTPRFDPDMQPEYGARLGKIVRLMQKEFYVEEVSDEVNGLDDVVKIFNNVNSGGRQLSKGDLALAKISAYWPEVRETMQGHFDEWQTEGYSINNYQYKFDWLLRCINAILTGHADFAELGKPEYDFAKEDIQEGLQRATRHIDKVLNLFQMRLGLDHRQVMGSPNALPVILRLLEKEGSGLSDQARDKLLYWHVHALLWGHFAGSVESTIRQDLVAIDENQEPISALINRLRDSRGNLHINPWDFDGFNRGDRFYSLLYMLTRAFGTLDLSEGIGLKKGLFGDDYRLEVHHIFPKAQLRKHGYRPQKEANAVANFTFLFKKTNRSISAKLPEEYLPRYEDKHPGVLVSHWIPTDPNLWKIKNYLDFLSARRELLANAANRFLGQLYDGTLSMPSEAEHIPERKFDYMPTSTESDEEYALLHEAMSWMEEHGLPRGVLGHEVLNSENHVIATLDLAWPLGVKEGISQQVALLIDESPDILQIANANGFRYFTDIMQLKIYVQTEILGE